MDEQKLKGHEETRNEDNDIIIEISKKSLLTGLMYGTIFLGSFGAGIYKGYCNSRGLPMPIGVEPAITYLMPLTGAGIAGVGQLISSSGWDDADGLTLGVSLIGGSAAGGLGSLISGGIGYGAGCLASKLLG